MGANDLAGREEPFSDTQRRILIAAVHAAAHRSACEFVGIPRQHADLFGSPVKHLARAVTHDLMGASLAELATVCNVERSAIHESLEKAERMVDVLQIVTSWTKVSLRAAPTIGDPEVRDRLVDAERRLAALEARVAVLLEGER